MSETLETFSMGDSIKCPVCGDVTTDLWDYHIGDEGSTEVDCDCGITFNLYKRISVHYTATYKDPE